uniref:Uncharacterized protein n=1 Tax=Thermosphaera aggregans TaxID=54254 RepID=A0A7C2BKK9_9CREN
MSIEDLLSLYGVIVLIAILGSASALWFFRQRRKLIVMLRDVTLTLEKYFNPSGKEYQWLGYLVGFKARYILPGKHRVYLLLTTVPRHSLLYYPFAKIAGRKDRLEIAFSPSDRVVTGEVYLVKKNSRVDRTILRSNVGDRLERMFSKEVKGFYEYIVFYSDESLYDKVAGAVAGANLPVTMIATYPGENIVSVAYDLSLTTLNEFLAFHDRLVKELTVPRAGRK